MKSWLPDKFTPRMELWDSGNLNVFKVFCRAEGAMRRPKKKNKYAAAVEP